MPYSIKPDLCLTLITLTSKGFCSMAEQCSGVMSTRTFYAQCSLVSTTNFVCLRQHIAINVSLLQGNKIGAHTSASFMQLAQQCETLQSLLLIVDATL